MTELSLARLCAFSYIHLPEEIVSRIPVRMSAVCEALLARGRSACAPLEEDACALLRAIADTLETAALRLVQYIDNNAESGFAACAFSGREGLLIAMRGSEKSGPCSGRVDWIDNFAAPFVGSKQYADIEKMLMGYINGPLLITGHSKGGHNALYALSVAPNSLARAVVFNAQGFGRGQLGPAQIQRLRARGRNYVTRGDIVGRLLFHPERRTVVCPVLPPGGEGGPGYAHRLGALCFDERGALLGCGER